MKLFQPGRINIKEFYAVALSCKATYLEVIQTGGIRSSAVGDNISISLQASVCGDILLFFEPNKNTYPQMDVYELILADKSLDQQKETALKSFQQKFQGLLLLPQLIVWSISMVIASSIFFNSESIFSNLQGNINPILTQYVLPFVVPVVIIYFRKAVGFGFISLFFRTMKHFSKG